MVKTIKKFNVVVIGAGINGCAVAAELASMNLRVLLFDKANIAGGTSSNSSSLIHGGLRYLQQYDFSMVYNSLVERQRLLKLAPHLVRPLRFVVPKHKNISMPFWLMRLGILFYDKLNFKNTLPASHYVSRIEKPRLFAELRDSISSGLQYYDCSTDDARLTITKAIQAAEFGAEVMPCTQILDIKENANKWHLTLKSRLGQILYVQADVVINASGSAVEFFSQKYLKEKLIHKISLVRGSHIIVPKLYAENHAYLLPNYDKRYVFALPFHGYTMVGTTEKLHSNNASKVVISAQEIDYLLNVANKFFKTSIDKSAIISTRSGLRVLLSSPYKKPFALSREYVIEFSNNKAPLIHVLGGKITTHAKLADTVTDILRRECFHYLPKTKRLSMYLPGAILETENGIMSFCEYKKYAQAKYSWLDKDTLNRYFFSYGTRTEKILASCNKLDDLGICFTHTLYQAEVDYLVREEWACDLYSILWLHTKLGLCISQSSKRALDDYLRTHKVQT